MAGTAVYKHHRTRDVLDVRGGKTELSIVDGNIVKYFEGSETKTIEAPQSGHEHNKTEKETHLNSGKFNFSIKDGTLNRYVREIETKS